MTFYPKERASPASEGFGALVTLDETLLPTGEMSAQVKGTGAEIISYVYRGALAQEDSDGNSGVVHSGEFQYMIVGKGVRLKEKNPSRTASTHLFRIFLRPSVMGLDSDREQMRFPVAIRHNRLCVIASPDGRKNSFKILQDALIYSSIFESGHHLVHELLPGRVAWVQVIHGEAAFKEIILTGGDGVGISFEPSVSVTAQEKCEILLIDLGPEPRLFVGRSG